MPQTDVPRARLLDPVGLRFHPVAGRDGERTPMPWTGDAAAGAGFTAPRCRAVAAVRRRRRVQRGRAARRPGLGALVHAVTAGAPPRARRPADRRVHRSRRRRRCVGVAARRDRAGRVQPRRARPRPSRSTACAATVRLGTRPGRDGEALDGDDHPRPLGSRRRDPRDEECCRGQSESRKTGWSGAMRRSSSSVELALTPSKKTPTSAFQRFRYAAQDRDLFVRRRSRSRGTARSGGRPAAHPIRRRAGCAPTG